MGHYELITAWFFFGKLALKKHFFEVHTPRFANPPHPIVHTCCEIFLLFFWWLPKSHNMTIISKSPLFMALWKFLTRTNLSPNHVLPGVWDSTSEPPFACWRRLDGSGPRRAPASCRPRRRTRRCPPWQWTSRMRNYGLCPTTNLLRRSTLSWCSLSLFYVSRG